MDELSLYATIGSIILIQIAFIWLHKQDRRRRKLSIDYIEHNRPLVVLVAPEPGRCPRAGQATGDGPERGQHFIDTLAGLLRADGFALFLVLLAAPDGTAPARGARRRRQTEVVRLPGGGLAPGRLERLQRRLRAALTNGGHKLHALVQATQLTSFGSAPDVRAKHELASRGILSACGPLVAQDGTHIVHVHEARRPPRPRPISISGSPLQQTAPAPIQVRIERLHRKGRPPAGGPLAALLQPAGRLVSWLRGPARPVGRLAPEVRPDQDRHELDKRLAAKIRDLLLLEEPKSVEMFI